MKDDGLILFDNIAYARNEYKFNKAMEDMQNAYPELHEWLITHGDIDKWALSRFPFKRWDNITTNIAESFNAWMLDERRHNVSALITNTVKRSQIRCMLQV